MGSTKASFNIIDLKGAWMSGLIGEMLGNFSSVPGKFIELVGWLPLLKLLRF